MLEEQIGEFVNNRKDIVQEQCRVCGDPAAGFHFGVFTCEGCKSFFGRAHQKKLLSECKNKGKCDVNRNTRTKCKLCRLQKCLSVGMSKEASRYGRRSTYFKVHCMAEKQAKQKLCKTESLSLNDSDSSGTSPSYVSSLPPTPAAISTNSNLPSVEKIMSNSPFPTRPVPCYPTYSPYGYNPFLYFTPVNLSSHVNIIGQKSSFSFNNYNINEQQPQSTPLDLSQKSSRINNGKFKVVEDSSSSVIIKKTFDFNPHHHHNHSTNHFQVSSIEAVL